jgi:endoglucanase
MRSRKSRATTLSATRAGLRRALPFAWLAAWLLVFGLLPPHEEVSAAPGALEVSGNSITYDGSPVRLHGVATEDVYDLYLEGRDPEAEYARMANNWRANVVRISVHPSTWRYHETETLALLEEHVQAATSAGLFVIVDYHVIGFPDGYYQPVPPEWGDPPDLYDSDFALATDFWDTVSTEIQDGRVMFELWNEPVNEEELPPSDPDSSQWSQLKPYFEDLISTIRANGSESVILATGNHWAYNLKGIKDDPLDDPNTAYTWHVYAGHEGNDPSRWAAALDGLHTVKPVVVTEWGFQPRAHAHYRGTAKTFGIKFRDRFLQGRGLHSTAWCWSASYGPSLFKRDWRTRTVWGDFAYDYLRAHNRDPARP